MIPGDFARRLADPPLWPDQAELVNTDLHIRKYLRRGHMTGFPYTQDKPFSIIGMWAECCHNALEMESTGTCSTSA